MSEIQVVRSGAYLAGLNVVHETDECLTHIAQINHPTSGRRNCYVKYYLDGALPSKGLINEVCGHVLAERAGLPVAPAPLILTMPSEQLAEIHPHKSSSLSLSGDVVTWVTGQVRGAMLPRSSEVADEILRRWNRLPDLIALDTWIVIPDRQASNLIRGRGNQIVPIDYGHLTGSVCWLPDLLQPDTDPRHIFLNLWPGQRPETINQGIMMAAGRHADCYGDSERELKHWTNAILGSGQATIALLEFLRKRAYDSPARMKRILGLLV